MTVKELKKLLEGKDESLELYFRAKKEKGLEDMGSVESITVKKQAIIFECDSWR